MGFGSSTPKVNVMSDKRSRIGYLCLCFFAVACSPAEVRTYNEKTLVFDQYRGCQIYESAEIAGGGISNNPYLSVFIECDHGSEELANGIRLFSANHRHFYKLDVNESAKDTNRVVNIIYCRSRARDRFSTVKKRVESFQEEYKDQLTYNLNVETDKEYCESLDDEIV